jgi:hypothetical protein
MSERTQSQPTLPANRSFVVQFRCADPEGGTRFEGRIEHLASGHSEHFSSHSELCKLLDQLIPGSGVSQVNENH